MVGQLCALVGSVDQGQAVPVTRVFANVVSACDRGGSPTAVHVAHGVLRGALAKGCLLGDQSGARTMGIVDVPPHDLRFAVWSVIDSLSHARTPSGALCILSWDRDKADAALARLAAAYGCTVVTIREAMDSVTLRHALLSQRIEAARGGMSPVETDADVQRGLFGAGVAVVPGELSTWFCAVGRATVLGGVWLFPWTKAVQLLRERPSERDYIPIAQTADGDAVWEARITADWPHREVRVRTAAGVQPFAPNLMEALLAFERAANAS